VYDPAGWRDFWFINLLPKHGHAAGRPAPVSGVPVGIPVNPAAKSDDLPLAWSATTSYMRH
jgi:hypothetical protein